jgi:hypothetical protein
MALRILLLGAALLAAGLAWRDKPRTMLLLPEGHAVLRGGSPRAQGPAEAPAPPELAAFLGRHTPDDVARGILALRGTGRGAPAWTPEQERELIPRARAGAEARRARDTLREQRRAAEAACHGEALALLQALPPAARTAILSGGEP